MKMKLFSEVTGKEYEVKTYPMEKGMRGICHESLLDILENQLDGISYNTEVLVASESYCAAKCVIADITDDGTRKIQVFNDVNTHLLEGREPDQEKFAKSHPLLAATQSAIDTAVRTYLKWSKSYPDENIGTTIIQPTEPILTNSFQEDCINIDDFLPNNDDKEERLNNYNEENEEINEDEKIEEHTETLEESEPELKSEPMQDPEPNNKTESKSSDRLAELGKQLAPESSKYSKLTLDEIWEKYPGWFSYVKNNSKSLTYRDVGEYVRLREEKEQH